MRPQDLYSVVFLGGLSLACREATEGSLGSQPSVQAYLVVHVEPMAREPLADCLDPELSECGAPVAYSWERRTENLSWLLDTWSGAGRTLDLQIGPEAGLSWMGDAGLQEALVSSFGRDGDGNGEMLEESEATERFSALVDGAQQAILNGVESGSTELGVHVHTVLPDSSGQWGTAPKGRGTDSQSPCQSWSEAPLEEGTPSIVERVVFYGVDSVAPIAAWSGVTMQSFTGHLPRTMAGKIAVVEEPDSLDPDIATEFTENFKPVNLGSAYSECLHQLADHPPLEPWPADPVSPLARGSGPIVVPGERVVGGMGEHLDVWADTAASAAARRMIQLLLNWRIAGLRGEADRPWVFTFHTHLYQLNPGTPGALDPTARQSSTREGGAFRGDLEALAGLLDRGSAWSDFSGVHAVGGNVVEWIQPSMLVHEGSQFDLWSADQAPLDTLDLDSYPYLSLVTSRLKDSHLVCEGQKDGVTFYGFSRCASGWTWGSPGPGYACTDGREPDGVFVLLPSRSGCFEVESASLQVGALTESDLGQATWCGGQSIEVPVEGLIVEPSTGLSWMSDSCFAWR